MGDVSQIMLILLVVALAKAAHKDVFRMIVAWGYRKSLGIRYRRWRA